MAGLKARADRAEYKRCFEGIRGISSRSNFKDGRGRFRLLDNMYVDYEGGADAVESIPGFRRLFSLGGRINGLYIQRVSPTKEYLIIHAQDRLYSIDKSKIDSGNPSLSSVPVNDRKSTAFSFEKSLYIMDGSNIIRSDEDGCFTILDGNILPPYVPILRRNEEMLEDRNLLTDLAREVFIINDPYKYSYESPGLKFRITDEKEKTCALIDGRAASGTVSIPAYTVIGLERYEVTEIAPHAFYGNNRLTELITHPSLLKIGERAFASCQSLHIVNLPTSLELIDGYAFHDCNSLNMLTFNRFPVELAESCFLGCESVIHVHCAGDISEYSRITAGTGIENALPIECEPFYNPMIGLKVYRMFNEIESVTVGITEIPFYFDFDSSTVRADFLNLEEFVGKEIVVHGRLSPSIDPEFTDEGGFLSTEKGAYFGGWESILGCKISESHEGRIFLSGNPELPGTVFFSGKDHRGTPQPTYFGVRDYFIDGITGDSVTDLLSLHGELAVFKSADDGSGTIFYHNGKDLANGKSSYPVSYVHGSIPVYGGAVSFFDEPLFLTDRGVCALEKVNGSDYREVRCRSENITSLLCKEDMSRAEITEWMGYLAVAFGGRIYLADSRDTYREGGVLQYEWYRLSGIGTYKNDRRLYRYSTLPLDGYELSDDPDGEVSETVYSEDKDGNTVYFVWDGDKKIRVYPTDEFIGGDFDPLSRMISDGRLLFFGTEGGDVCVFNNDKRGVPPEAVASEEGFDPVEYENTMGDRIHPSFYSFAGHRANYGALTAFDDCGVPHLTKSSVRDSLVIKLKIFTDSKIRVRAETDLGSSEETLLPLSRLSFERTDFSAMTASTSDFVTVTLPEAERGWTEKRYSVFSDGFCSPFGVYSISYRYKIKGKIKE